MEHRNLDERVTELERAMRELERTLTELENKIAELRKQRELAAQLRKGA